MAVIRAILKYDRAMFAREGFINGDLFHEFKFAQGDVYVQFHDFKPNELIELYWRQDDHPRAHIDVTIFHPRDFE